MASWTWGGHISNRVYSLLRPSCILHLHSYFNLFPSWLPLFWTLFVLLIFFCIIICAWLWRTDKQMKLNETKVDEYLGCLSVCLSECLSACPVQSAYSVRVVSSAANKISSSCYIIISIAWRWRGICCNNY